ncbi:TIGR00730 family Rossman fold protein [Cryomorphaceae bacterium]|nr:TIGR00730 family Rossman fold protein [Cryomorphaceae bacterium]
MTIKRVCVYCASSAKIDPVYFEETRRLARALVAADIDVVYGGGAVGLMGTLADTVIQEGGRIKGIMPKFMNEVEWAHKDVTDFEFTNTMHERKAKFLEGIDGLITLPGGSGTLEEFFEAITLKRLGQFTKPIVVLNTNGFYDPLKELLEMCVSQKFMHEKHLAMWDIVDRVEDVLPSLENAQAWDDDPLSFATNK